MEEFSEEGRLLNLMIARSREYVFCIGTGYTGEKCVMDGDVVC